MSHGKIVIYGAGSIGSTIGGWMTPNYPSVHLIARREHAEVMKEEGLTLSGPDESSEKVLVNVIKDLSEVTDVKVLVLAVKNYDLKEAAKDISSKLDDKVTVVALQNGVENQLVLQKIFSKVIYGVVGYSAMIVEPGVVKYQSRGPVYLGTIDNRVGHSLEEICELFNLGLDAEVTPCLQNTVHCKIVLNLTNALFTLIGLHYRKITSYAKLATITSRLINEGIDVIQAAGYKEYSMKNYPSWRTLKLSLKLPTFIRTAVLKRNLKHSILNSMGQDVLIKGKKETELEFLNGYMLNLANSVGVKTPLNTALYKLCKNSFSRTDFHPLSIEKVWNQLDPESIKE